MYSGAELGAAIRSALEKKGVTQKALAEHFGVRQSSITGWLQRGTISKDKLPSLWSYFEDVVGPEHWGLLATPKGLRDVGPSDFGGLNGEVIHHVIAAPAPDYATRQPQMAVSTFGVGGKLVESSTYVQIRRVRLKLSAGVSGFAVEYLADDEEEPLWFLRSFISKQGWRPDKLLALKVKGRSMEPGLTEGDTVLINTASQEPKDGIAFAVNYEGEAVIKRLVRDAGQWWLVSDNPDQTRYPRKVCDEHVRIVGEVVQKQSLRI